MRGRSLDRAGNIHIAGDFKALRTSTRTEHTFPIAPLNAGGQNATFSLCKAGPVEGNFIWAKRMGGTGSERDFGIAVNSAQEVCTTGNFSGTADRSGTAEATSLAPRPDIYVSKLEAFGELRLESSKWAAGR
ncbi:MAG: hypothetical protein IPH60_15025 [Flavobacteriales bacterium]|nr:hypothetical protein [Flavobacteriales bacterium]